MQAINTGDGLHVLARLGVLRLRERGFEAATVLEAARELDDEQLRARPVRDMAHGKGASTPKPCSLPRDRGQDRRDVRNAVRARRASSAGAPRDVDVFRRFGHHAGMAFRAADDLGIWATADGQACQRRRARTQR
ncbi:MAG: hypothetical protein U0360_05420 [Dehalococcoidia bacterium]